MVPFTEVRKCKNCDCEITQHPTAKFCGPDCRKKYETKLMNQNWAKKEKKTQHYSVTHDFLNRSHCKKGEGLSWMKKYRAVRG